MLEIYGVNKQGLVFISQRGRKYNKRTIQQIVENAARKARIKARETNNIVEKLHETLKDRLKPLRHLKSEETAKIWLDGWFVYYNFLRPHLSLKGKTHAEACGIDLNIENCVEKDVYICV